jgi:hypothetical protein
VFIEREKMNAQSQEAKELGTVSRPWRRGYSVPNLNANNASANSSSMQRPSGEELMNLRLRKVRHDANVFLCTHTHTLSAGVRDQKKKKKKKKK